jgi:serine/threonine protein kinase/WD40 repeat protein
MNASEREAAIAAEARALSPAVREAFLDKACAGDPALRARVEAALGGGPAVSGTAAAAALHFALEERPEETAGATIGPYKLLQPIGQGGFGTVWMAEQQEPLRRRVALKVIKLGMDTREVIARFEAERQALALMEHPNIARVFDAGATASGRPYFVMELVRGIPITRYCDENKLTAEARLRLFIAVCHGVQHAHHKGVIHRDLKPSNILVTLHDGVAAPKIIDFGIAKATSGARLTEKTLFTQFHAFVGTPVYTSPEQMEMSGLDVDTRSDVYSLGVLLYELLAGRPPFDASALVKSGLEAMRRTIREIDPPRPSQRVRTLSNADRSTVARERGTDAAKLQSMLHGDLDAIAMHCLEKDRTRRYETASALAADVERHLRHEPIVARPPTEWYRVAKFVRRHRIGVGAAAAVVLSLCAGLVAASILLARERSAHRRAVASERAEMTLRHQADAAREAETIRASRTARDLAERLLAEGRSADGLAWLVHAARKNPRDSTIAPRLASALTSRNFVLPAGTLNLGSPVMNVHYTDGGRKCAVYCEDGTIAIIDVASGTHVRTQLPCGLAAPGVVISGRVVVVRGKDDVLRVVDPASGRVEREITFAQKVAQISAANERNPILVVMLADRSLVVAEAMTGRTQTLPVKLPFTGGIELSPDGRWMGLANLNEHEGQLWDLRTGELRTTQRLPEQMGPALFSPDGTCMLVVRRDDEKRMSIVMLSVPDWTPVFPPQPLPEQIPATLPSNLTFSPDGRAFSVRSAFGQQVYETATGAPIGPVLPPAWLRSTSMSDALRRALDIGDIHSKTTAGDAIFRIAKEGLQIVTVTGVGPRAELTLREVATGRPVHPPLVLDGPLTGARSSADGNTLLVLDSRGTLWLWDMQTGRVLAEPGLEHDVFEGDVALAPDGHELVIGGANGLVRRMRPGRGAARPLRLPRTVPMMPAPFLPESAARLLWLTANHAMVIDVASGVAGAREQFPESIRGITPDVGGTLGISVRADGRYIVVQPEAGGWQAWELDGAVVRRAVPLEHAPPGKAWVCYSPSGDLVAMVPELRQEFQFWDLATGRAVGKPLNIGAYIPAGEPRRVACFNRDARLFVTGGLDGFVKVWQFASRTMVAELPPRLGAVVTYIDVSADGTRIATSNAWAETRLWELPGGRPASAVLRGSRSVFSSDGERLLAWDSAAARVWDGHSGAVISGPMAHPDNTLRSATFSREGRRVVTAADDCTARVWDARAGQPLTVPLTHPTRVGRAEFSPDGRFVRTEQAGAAASNQPPTFCVWSVPPDCGDAAAPEWLLQLATLCAQKTINDAGECVETPEAMAQFDDVRRALAASPGDAPFVEWGRWILDDRADRPIAPGFTITPAEAERLAESLRLAAR